MGNSTSRSTALPSGSWLPGSNIFSNLGSLLLLIPIVLGTVRAGFVNLALHQPVISSGPTWTGFQPGLLTDGDPNTFSHPLTAAGTLNYYFEVDLGQVHSLEKIVLHNRADGCCPERLSRYGVDVYDDDGGETGALTWSANLRTNGSNSGVSGVDVIMADSSPTGRFAGRFIRIVNRSGAAYNPQLAEIEVYGAPTPVISLFTADPDVLHTEQSTTLSWAITNATGARLEPLGIAIPPSNGTLSVIIRTNTSFTLIATNEAGLTTSNVTVAVDVVLAPPQITEFLADNVGALRDEDGDSADWIELYNPNPYHLPVGGYHLTDDPKNYLKWTFPPLRIPPHQRLMVFASGKDRKDPSVGLHTNFKLNASGDYLALTLFDGTVLQQFPVDFPTTQSYPPQSQDASYGIDGAGVPGYFRPATPGAENGPSFVGVVAPLQLSHTRGFSDTNLLLTLSCPTEGVVIRYTTNRTEPTAGNGIVYSAPVWITNTTVVRASAFRDRWAPPPVVTHTYLFPSNIINSSVMRTSITRNPVYAPKMENALLSLPSVSLTTSKAINGTSEVAASLEWIRPDGQPGFQENCGVRLYGGAFTDFAKKSFRLYFRSEFGTGRLRYPVFEHTEPGLAPVETFNQLELRNGSHDMVERGFYMANIFTDDTVQEMGHLNPHGRWVHLYLNGTYWGVYHLRERWDASMHSDYLGGGKSDYESINGNWNVGGWAEPGVPYDGDGSVWARVKALRGNYAAVQEWLDVPEYIDYMLMWMFGGSEDEYRCVGPNIPGSGLKFYLNDADGWFCGSWYCAADNRTGRGSPGRQSGDGPGSIFSMLFKEGNPEYRVLLADRIQRALFSGGALTPARNMARLTHRASEFEKAFPAESARWGYLDPAAWSGRRNSVQINWLPNRTAAYLVQLRSAGFYPGIGAPIPQPMPTSNPGIAEIHFSGSTAGTIFYTVDGADPRVPGGAVSPSASNLSLGGQTELLEFEIVRQGANGAPGLPTISRNTLMKCRAQKSGQWSALTETFLQIGDSAIAPGEIVVSELNFNPPGWDNSEFVEILNISERAVNLRGAAFTNGLKFSFPDHRDTPLAPGQRLVLVNDLLGFQKRYGRTVPVAGIFSGQLNNNGERIVLVSPAGLALLDFRYDAALPWPVDAGAGGFTLTLAHPQLGLTNPFAWRTSVDTNGSPGGTDSVAASGESGEDRDGDGIPAWLEQALGTLDTDPVSGPEAVQAALSPSGQFVVTVPRNLRIDRVQLQVEASANLSDWTPATLLSTRTDGDGIARETWGYPGLAGSKGFMRLRAVLGP